MVQEIKLGVKAQGGKLRKANYCLGAFTYVLRMRKNGFGAASTVQYVCVHYLKNRKKIIKDPEASKVFLLQLASLKQALTQGLREDLSSSEKKLLQGLLNYSPAILSLCPSGKRRFCSDDGLLSVWLKSSFPSLGLVTHSLAQPCLPVLPYSKRIFLKCILLHFFLQSTYPQKSVLCFVIMVWASGVRCSQKYLRV